MTWYVASVIMSIRLKKGKQSKIPVFENFFLVSGKTREQAAKKAEKIAKLEAEAQSDGLSLNDKPAIMKFDGIRKLVSVANPVPMELDKERPDDGTELSYNEYIVVNKRDLKKLATGKQVELLYLEN